MALRGIVKFLVVGLPAGMHCYVRPLIQLSVHYLPHFNHSILGVKHLVLKK